MYPELKVHFMGSAALRICGQKDLDYIIDCHPESFNLYISGLTSLLGQPKKNRPTFVEWETNQHNYHIDLLLMDPSNPVSIKTLKIFDIFISNQEILKQYEQLKMASNGVSIREYKRIRMEFFQKILKK